MISTSATPRAIVSRATLGSTSKRRGPAAPGLRAMRPPSSRTMIARCVGPKITTLPR